MQNNLPTVEPAALRRLALIQVAVGWGLLLVSLALFFVLGLTVAGLVLAFVAGTHAVVSHVLVALLDRPRVHDDTSAFERYFAEQDARQEKAGKMLAPAALAVIVLAGLMIVGSTMQMQLVPMVVESGISVFVLVVFTAAVLDLEDMEEPLNSPREHSDVG
ncbi:MAG: hypothetical protein ACFB51_04745 [Anaerolineae bacterium]